MAPGRQAYGPSPARDSTAVLLHVPSAGFNHRPCHSQFARAVGGCDFAPFARQQRDVVILPDYGENFLALGSLVQFQAHKKRQIRTWILYGHMSDGFFPLAFGSACSPKFYLWQLRKRGVIGKRFRWSHPPVA